ncbi:uncharacterized protein Bfra_001423 [Botrytis fragariae]|uniref:Uncharacterized protein n=1 Tax=Botrytis fragariae TaxID=1964551 RepID=A0A8H6B0X4_9HELO|nr:uncharacterized protein Bfra_001423 [Botrytis fragariae]KAF5877062.1 hypothetical protein Bfra_001423 [Botrytis fragariae]
MSTQGDAKLQLLGTANFAAGNSFPPPDVSTVLDLFSVLSPRKINKITQITGSRQSYIAH